MNCTPVKDLDGVSSKELVKQAKEIVKSIEESWNKDAVFKFTLKNGRKVKAQTYHKDGLNQDYWAARVTDFASFDEEYQKLIHDKFLRYIGGSTVGLKQTHTEFEKEYIDLVDKMKLQPIKLAGEEKNDISYLALVIYKFKFPLSTRVFNELIHVHRDEADDALYIVSLPIDRGLVENGGLKALIIAKYASIEKVAVDKRLKSLKWTMCTCSDAGGWIPKWLSKMKINEAVAQDVPSFLNWCDKQPN